MSDNDNSPVDQLCACGLALYGDRWQSLMARGYGCSRRAMTNYANGSRLPPPALWLWLSDQLAERRDVVAKLAVMAAGMAGNVVAINRR